MEGDPAEIVPEVDLVGAVNIITHGLQNDDLDWPLTADVSHDGIGKLGERGGPDVSGHTVSVLVHHKKDVAFVESLEERLKNARILVDESILGDRNGVVDHLVAAPRPVVYPSLDGDLVLGASRNDECRHEDDRRENARPNPRS